VEQHSETHVPAEKEGITLRRVIALILLAFILFSGPVSVYAAEANASGEQEIVDEGGTFERIVATLVEFPIRVVQAIASNVAETKSLDKLIFLSGVSDEEKKTTPWNANEVEFIKLWYAALLGLSMPLYIIAIAVSGFKLTMSGTNPGMRKEAIDSIWRWFGAAAIVLLAPLLVQTLLWITNVVLEGIQFAFGLVTESAGIGRSISDWGGISFGGLELTTGSVLGTAIVKVMFAFIWFWFNAIYFIRKLVLTVMICFTPIMALLWALNKNVNAAGIWLGELASNAFMPIAHALVLCVILGFLDIKNISSGSWFQILIAVYTIMPLAEVIRNSMQQLMTRFSGIDEAATAGKAITAAVGLGGILSLGRVAKSTVRRGDNLSGTSAGLGGGPTGPSGGGGLAPIPVGGGRQIGFTSPDITRGNQQTIGFLSTSPASSGTSGTRGNTTMPGGSSTSTGTIISQTQGSSGGTREGPSSNVPPNTSSEGTSAGGGRTRVPPIGLTKETQALESVVKAGNVAGQVTRYTGGALVNMVGGAIPQGKVISPSINRGMEVASRGLAAAGALGYQTIKQAKQSGKGIGQALQDITGADSTLTAVGRGIMLTAKTAYSNHKGMEQARAYAANSPSGLDGGRVR